MKCLRRYLEALSGQESPRGRDVASSRIAASRPIVTFVTSDSRSMSMPASSRAELILVSTRSNASVGAMEVSVARTASLPARAAQFAFSSGNVLSMRLRGVQVAACRWSTGLSQARSSTRHPLSPTPAASVAANAFIQSPAGATETSMERAPAHAFVTVSAPLIGAPPELRSP